MRDSNPRRRCQLIYSQPPLAARVICRTSKEDHSRLPCSERLFPVRSASSNRGQDNFTELPPKNRIGVPAVQKGAKKPGNSGFSEDAACEFGLDPCRLQSSRTKVPRELCRQPADLRPRDRSHGRRGQPPCPPDAGRGLGAEAEVAVVPSALGQEQDLDGPYCRRAGRAGLEASAGSSRHQEQAGRPGRRVMVMRSTAAPTLALAKSHVRASPCPESTKLPVGIGVPVADSPIWRSLI